MQLTDNEGFSDFEKKFFFRLSLSHFQIQSTWLISYFDSKILI